MATNKNALIRYQALDKCFSNYRKCYYIEDLIEACNNALSEYDSSTSGVQRRQIFDDINFMKDPLGYDAPIESIKDGKRVYYRYSDKDYSINKQPLNPTEAQALTDTIAMLGRFKGLPNFEWMEEVTSKLETTFSLNNSPDNIVGFDQNIDLRGLKFFTPLFEYIVAKKTIRVKYSPFNKETTEITISPYYLKQYNNRWFLFGKCKGFDNLTNIALDRIDNIKEGKEHFVENASIDFNEYFEDIVGVTHPKDGKEQKVVLKVADDFLGYFLTKPIHGSLKKRPNNVFELKLIPNYELETYLFSHSDKIKVLEPEQLRQAIISRIDKAKDYQEK
ncbi:MAG: WYL domain-containing protein [Bacteroidales bacterium]|nr:WYL domain-containing protein [Bacteroidales bacterium]